MPETRSSYPTIAAEGLGDLPGRVLDPAPSAAGTARYRVDALLSGGSQALVFAATRLSAEGAVPVVVKVWRPSFVRALPREAALSLRKEWLGLERQRERVPRSPYVVHGLDRGELRGEGLPSTPWVALEHVAGGPSGTTLHERVAATLATSGTGLAPARARRLLEALVTGVNAIHETGLFHRDLKPSNVLVTGDGPDERFKVSDLGVARAAGMATTFGAHVALGSVGYAAPEQASGRDLGPWSDTFSLGALLFFALTGEALFPGTAHTALAHMALGKRPSLSQPKSVHAAFARAGVLAELDRGIAWATEPSVEARPVSVLEWGERIRPLLAAAEALDPSASDPPPAQGEPPSAYAMIHRPVEPMTLRAAAISVDGTAIAAGPAGLFAWDGAGTWEPFSWTPEGLEPARIGGLAGPFGDLWLASVDGGELVGFGADRAHFRHRLGPPSALAGPVGAAALGELAVAFRLPDGETLLAALVGGAWLPPLGLPGIQVTALAPAGGGRFVLGAGAQRGLWAPAERRLTWEAAAPGAWFVDARGALWNAGPGGIGPAVAPRPPASAGYLALRASSTHVTAVGHGGWIVQGRVPHAP